MRVFRGIPLFLLAFLSTSFAQTTLGVLRGVATDPTGALVPGVSVVARNVQTNIEHRTTTNVRGQYEVINLNPGRYEVTAEASGFKRFVVSNILLETAQTVRVDLKLEVGEVTTSVNVEATAPVINTEGAEVATVASHEVMVRLPINTRGTWGGGFYYTLLTFATPGAERGQGSNFSFAGARGFQWGTTVDGISQRSPLFANSIGPAQSSMDMTGEMRIQLANDKAESSTPGGFYATTRSGTNDVHGAVFWHYNSSSWNARDPFSTSVPNTKLRDYGGAIGGPIAQNRTFYFVTYERAPSTQERIWDSDLPTLAFRKGDFSSLSTTIVDPLTGIPFSGNIIPPDRISSVSQKVQDRFYPEPNFGAPDSYRSNWRGVGPGDLYKTQVEGRIDHKISDSNNLFGRLSWIRGGGRVFDYNLSTMPKRDQDRRTTTMAISDSHIFSPTLINEARWGIMRTRNPAFNPIDGRALVSEWGLQGLAITDVGEGAPVFTFNNFETIGASDIYQDPSERIYHGVDNLTWIRGDHTIKTGVEIKWNRATNFPGGTSFPVRQFGVYNFRGTFTGFDYADFLLGLPQTSQRANPAPLFHMVNTDVSFYVQDDWKVTRTLTLNLGVRYEFNPPYHEKDGNFFNFDPASGRVIVPDERALARVSPLFPTDLAPVVTAAEAGFPKSLWYTDTNNFVPRFGFAWRPFASARTVVRGGYGIYIDDLTGSIWRLGTGGPFVSFETFTNNIVGGVPTFQFPRAFPGGFGAIGAQSFDAIDPHYRNPYIQQWNLTLEQEFWDTGFRLSYIGTNSRKLGWIQNINQPIPSKTPFSNDLRRFPNLRDISVRQNGAVQNYHSLHLTAERKMKSGLYYQLGWTYAKNLTDCQSDSERGCRPQDAYARHLEYSNVNYTDRHRLVGSLLWELPVGRGRTYHSNMSRVADLVLGGWTISAIANAETGEFFSPSFSGFDVSNTNNTGSQRPDRIADGNFAPSQRERSQWFDVSAFVVPGDLDGDKRPDVNVGRFGNSAPNTLVGPGLFAVHLGAHKYFNITERVRVVFQGTSTNALNHPNFRVPSGNIRSSSVAVIRRTHQRIGPRNVQIALRLEF